MPLSESNRKVLERTRIHLKPIPQTWIALYVNKLIKLAEAMPEGTMRATQLARAEHVLDMMEAFRNREETPPGKE